jgi:transposase-like protein
LTRPRKVGTHVSIYVAARSWRSKRGMRLRNRSFASRMVYLWRAVDAKGEVLDVLVQANRNKRAALE